MTELRTKEEKFTEGPWHTGGEIITNGEVRYNVWGPTPWGKQSGTMVCQLARPADAALIAAAPELLLLARQLASECAACDGSGERVVNKHHGDAIDDESEQCPECADIWSVIHLAEGKA